MKTKLAVATKNENNEFEITEEFDSFEAFQAECERSEFFSNQLTGYALPALTVLERNDDDVEGAWWLFDHFSEDEPVINPYFIASPIAIHTCASNDAPIIRFIDSDKFPFAVQVLIENGQFWGAYRNEYGHIVIVETDGDKHTTDIDA